MKMKTVMVVMEVEVVMVVVVMEMMTAGHFWVVNPSFLPHCRY